MTIGNKIAKFIIPILISISIFLIFVMPATSAVAASLVPCNNTPTVSGGVVTYAEPCDFNAFLALVNKVVKFILFDMVVPIAAIMFAYAGFLLVTSGGSTDKRGTAKKIFTSVAIGLIIAIAAWLIVHTVLSILGYKDAAWIGF